MRIKEWYDKLTTGRQVLYKFIVYFVIALFTRFWMDLVWETPFSLPDLSANAFMLASFLTIWFEWYNVKELFRKKKKQPNGTSAG